MADEKPFGEDWPKTDTLRVVDKIGVPHPYCIGSKLVGYASDHWGGILGEAAIRDAEEHGIICDICRQVKRKGGKALSYEEHKQALLIEVSKSLDTDSEEGKGRKELRAYLLSIKERTEKEGYAGFAFKRAD